MSWMVRVALAASVAVAAITGSFAAALQAPNSAPAASSPSLDAVVGKKLVSIDGSTVTLTTLEGTLVRETVAANGAIRRTSFHFITDQLGTVMDQPNPNKAVGVFRMSKRDVTVQYADGGFETISVNDEGGLLVESKAPERTALCTAWYPEGHVFSMEDRKAAVAQYASRLGIAESGDKLGPARNPSPSCGARDDLAAKTADTEKNSLAAVLGLGLPLAALPSASPAPATFAIAQATRTADSAAKTALEAGSAGTRAPLPALPQTAGRSSPEQLAQSR